MVGDRGTSWQPQGRVGFVEWLHRRRSPSWITSGCTVNSFWPILRRMPLDRSGNDCPDNSAAGAEDVLREPGMVKERETKEDGRYIIFYSFDGEEAREDA